jgi:large subunit ribosomal protein L10
MKKEEKKLLIEEIEKRLQSIEQSTLLFVDFGRVKANSIAGLRKDFRKTGVFYKVVKTDLLRIACKNLRIKVDANLFKGNVAMATFAGEPTELAKKFSEIKDEEGNLLFNFKGGFVDGKWYDANEIGALSKLPPKSILVAQLLYLVNSPISRLVTVLSKPQRDFVTVLNQIKENMQQGAA